MKKIIKLLAFMAVLLFAVSASAEGNILTVELGIFDYGTIMIPSEATFELHSSDGECVAEAKANMVTVNVTTRMDFIIPDYKENEIYYLVPKSGVTELSYVGCNFGIDSKVPLNTADGMYFPVEAIPLYKPKTGLRANSVIVNVHMRKKVASPVQLSFALLNSEGMFMSVGSTDVNPYTEVAQIAFSVPQYYTGEQFYLVPLSGMESTVYYSDTYTRNSKIRLDTFASLAWDGTPIIGNVFDVSVYTDAPEAVEEMPAAEEAAPVAYEEPKAQVPQETYGDSYATRVENFVNGSGIGSKTDYFIWISKKDYKVNVLLRNNGVWDYYTSFDCTIGKPSTPTITGVFEYFAYQSKWTYENYYVAPIMRFAPKGYAMHSTLIKYNGQPYDARLRQQLSHGCVRLAPADIQWLADYVPLYSRVYITE